MLELHKYSPEKVTGIAEEMMHIQIQPIEVDNANEMASILLSMKK